MTDPGLHNSISLARAKRSTLELGMPSSVRTCRRINVAPALDAADVDSICSSAVIRTAELSLVRGKEPVMATEIMQGLGKVI